MGDGRARGTVVSIVIALSLGILPAIPAAGNGSEGHIWLDCDPGERAHRGGWQAGGIVCLGGTFAANALLTFDLFVTNRDNANQTDLQIVFTIHRSTTADDLVSVTITAPDGTVTTILLAEFGTSEFNPFDDAYGGRHHVYSGSDAIWKNYDVPTFLREGETAVFRVEVLLGEDPREGFELHLDAFDLDTGSKSPNGHDVTLISGGRGGPEPGQDRPNPCIVGGDSVTVFEGDRVVFDGTCSSDADGVIVGYEWDFDLLRDSDGDGDAANDVDATGAFVEFVWYDDYESDVLLVVTDNDGLTASAIQGVTVLNAAPAARFDGAFVELELSVRMAGEKWSNVNVDVHRNYDADTGVSDGLVGSMEVERWPGSPAANPNSEGPSFRIRAEIAGGDRLAAVVTYDPHADSGDTIRGDQPINGQLWGDNPIWLLLTHPDGSSCRLFHNFNVRQSLDRDRDLPTIFTEPWIVDLTAGATAGIPIDFVASASEVGSDDVVFTWDFGDGAVVSTIHLYDGARGPDPAFPPGSPYEPYLGGTMPPLALVDAVSHTYASAGTYTVTLTINDDDGGAQVVTFEVTVADPTACK